MEPDQLKRFHKDYSNNMSEDSSQPWATGWSQVSHGPQGIGVAGQETDTEVHRWSVLDSGKLASETFVLQSYAHQVRRAVDAFEDAVRDSRTVGIWRHCLSCRRF